MLRQDGPSEVNRPQTTIPSLWHLSAVAAPRFLDSALLELTPAAVASGWFQEGDIVDALEILQVDVYSLALSRMYIATHPNADVQTMQDRDPTLFLTQEAFGRAVCNCVGRLHSLQLVLYHTPIYTGGNKT
jgi:hypothetical protein